MRLQVQRHGERLAARAPILREIEMDRAAFLADQHRAGQEVAGPVAHLDGVEHRLGARLLRAELPEGQLRAEQAERKSRHGGQDPRCCGPSALHQAPPPRNIHCFRAEAQGQDSVEYAVLHNGGWG